MLLDGKTIVFRTDASVEMGSGHVMRCLTLADNLAMHGAICTFLTRKLSGNLNSTISSRSHRLVELPAPDFELPRPKSTLDLHKNWLGVPCQQDADECAAYVRDFAPDLMVVDNYALDAEWQNYVVPRNTKLLVYDDLADRAHNCDILLDQNLGRHASDYKELLPEKTIKLIGPEYAMLRPEFSHERNSALKRRNLTSLKTLLISMGGTDKDNATGEILQILKTFSLPNEFKVQIILGRTSPHIENVRNRARSLSCTTEVSINPTNIAKLMKEADLAIGASGGTTWERCCLGLPTLLLTIADNQIPAANALAQAGAVCGVADIRHSDWREIIADGFKRSIEEPDWLNSISESAANVCDGLGSIRVIDAISTCLLHSQNK